MPRRALLGLLFAVLLAAPGRTDEMLVDGIAAQVGNDIVLVSEVMQIVAPQRGRMRAEPACRRSRSPSCAPRVSRR